MTASVVAAVVRATPADRPGLATGTSNTVRQAGAAVFGAVAGSPHRGTGFLSAIHHLALLTSALWAVAAMVAAVTVEGRVAVSWGD